MIYASNERIFLQIILSELELLLSAYLPSGHFDCVPAGSHRCSAMEI